MRQQSHRLVLVAVFAAAILVAGPWLRSRLGIEVDFDVESVRAFAGGMGPMAPLLFVLVVAARALLWLPSQVVLIAAGLCFGTGLGALVGGTGLMLSGVFLFALARYAGPASVGSSGTPSGGGRLRALLDFSMEPRGAVALALALGYPLTPLSPLQASAGLTAMPLASFLPAAFIGGTIRASTYAWFGDAMLDFDGRKLAVASAILLAVVALPLATAGSRRRLRGIFAPPAISPSPGPSGGSAPNRP